MFVTVKCQHVIGGVVTGLIPQNDLVLHYTGSQNPFDLTIAMDGVFIFPIGFILNNDQYSVSILTQPSDPEQICILINGTGVINHTDIDNIEVRCSSLIFKDGFE